MWNDVTRNLHLWLKISIERRIQFHCLWNTATKKNPFWCNKFHQIYDMLYLSSVQIENALFLFSFTNLIKFCLISEYIFILFTLSCDYLYIEFSQWVCVAGIVLWAYIKNSKLECFYKILPNMCLFLFSEFIKACVRELSNSNFLYLLWFVLLYRNSPKRLIWAHETEFRLKGLNVSFTKRYSESKYIKVMLF